MPKFEKPKMPAEDKKQGKATVGGREIDWDKLIKDHPAESKLQDIDIEVEHKRKKSEKQEPGEYKGIVIERDDF